ncbi:MAG: TetR family transcriptional regulator, partial [Gammaproteobacteria bacterium]
MNPARKQSARVAAPVHRRGSLDQVLIDAAMDLFASYGYRGTSLARIAQAAGVTKGALYWHFADKEEFFLAVVAKVLGEWN